MSIGRNAIAIFAVMIASSIVSFAQEQPPPNTPNEAQQQRLERRGLRERGRHDRMRGPHGMGHFMRGLNLTDAQKEQLRAIRQRRLEATKTQREELFKLREKRIAGTFTADDEARAKALREEIRRSMEGVRAESEGVLTAEQKAQLEQLKTERKARHGERKTRREERLRERQEQLKTNPQ
jgi:periplasmic protein CpxP/Spy